MISVCPASQDTHPLHIGLLSRNLVVCDISSWVKGDRSKETDPKRQIQIDGSKWTGPKRRVKIDGSMKTEWSKYIQICPK